jgi:hypothetical protein
MQYEILVEDGIQNMERTVNQFLADGWELQGGISVVFFKMPTGGQATAGSMPASEKPVFRFYQAVVKKTQD